MPWDWAGPLSTAVVGVGGIIGTYKGTSRQAKVALDVAQAQIDGNANAQDRERTQKRIESAYVELARWMSLYGAWAANTMPIVTDPGYDPFPQPPGSGDDPAIHASEALAVYWSEAVASLLNAWIDARDKLVRVSSVARSDQEAGGAASLGLYQSAHEHRIAMRDAEKAVLAQIRKELRGEA